MRLPFASRFTPADLELFDPDERARFLRSTDGAGRDDIGGAIAWELLYRKEPDTYDRLVRGETIHPAVIERLPRVQRCVEVAAGTGRLTVHLADRCDELIAVEPVAAFHPYIRAKVDAVDIRRGFFDRIPAPDAWADLVVSCSAFTADPIHGGEEGLAEMERVARPGATVALVWPSDVDWLRRRGFTYESFGGEMAVDFGTPEEAIELAELFYPDAVDAIAERGSAVVPYEVLGINPPRDIAWKVVG